MESVEPMAPVAADDVVDRRELLAQQFEQAEAETSQVVARDNQGKFASQQAETFTEAEPPVWKRPPASWKKDYHEPWNAVDDKIKEYVWAREEQMRKGVEPLLSKAQFADQMEEVISPYRDTIRGLGIKESEAVKALMQADHTLRFGAPEQKQQMFMQLAQQYGVNLANQVASNSQNALMDPTIYALQNEVVKVKGQLQSWQDQQEQAQNATLLTEINGFAQRAEHFETARPTMISLLQSGAAQTLEDAYDMAIWGNPELREVMLEARQAQNNASVSAEKNRAAKAARAAAVSVRSSTPGTNTASKAQDRRSLLAEQFDALSERL